MRFCSFQSYLITSVGNFYTKVVVNYFQKFAAEIYLKITDSDPKNRPGATTAENIYEFQGRHLATIFTFSVTT